jgi:hypothetical protein
MWDNGLSFLSSEEWHRSDFSCLKHGTQSELVFIPDETAMGDVSTLRSLLS